MSCNFHKALSGALLFLGILSGNSFAGECTIDPDNDGFRYVYGENIGWVNLAPAQGAVAVSSSSLTGHAWGENAGWINFGPANGGVVNDGMGNLSGYAWGENTGWINFSPQGGGVSIDPVTGLFSGKAWGENIGWISFGSAGAVPFKVKVSSACVTRPFNGVCGSANGAVFTTTPMAGLCSTGIPIIFKGYGPWSWQCTGLYGGNDTVCSASIQTWPLSVVKGGTGAGTIASTLPFSGLNCGSVCSGSYGVNSIVSLVATPTTGSSFSAWSGCDSMNGRQCTVTMNGSRSVTASFASTLDVKVGSSFYNSIQSGFTAVTAGDLLKLRSTDFYTTQTFDRPITVTMRGGFNDTFDASTGMSTIHGSITVSSGTVILDNITIAAAPPTAGNNGTIVTSNTTSSGVSLQLSNASEESCKGELIYRAYYSDTDSLATVADMEKYGVVAREFTPTFVGMVTGKVNNALNFSGAEYVDAGNGAGLNFGTGSFSVEAWIKPSSWDTLSGIIGKGASSDGEPGYTLRLFKAGEDNYLQFVIGNGTQQVAAHKKGYAENNWYHLIGVADRTNNLLKLYVNGVLTASTSLSGFSGSTDVGVDLTVGKQYLSITQQDLLFKGIIDEAAVYNRVLSSEEITDRYNEGAGRSVETLSGLTAGWRFDEEAGSTVTDISGGDNTGKLHFFTTIDIAGLTSLVNYSLNVIVVDSCGNKTAYTPVTAKTSIIPISFSGIVVPYNMYMPAVADLNNDGFIEPLGTFNDGNGNLTAASAASLGLSRLFTSGRINRNCAVADFNGDNFPDIVCNVFSAYEPYTGSDPTCQAMAAGSPYSPNSVAMLFFNNGNGTFTESADFTSKNMRGLHGETILAADFNNDGYLDIFWPHASSCSPNEQSYLLVNDGHGNFTEVADEAGVSMRNWNLVFRGEGTQAVDFDMDGWIDFYVGSHLFINNGVKNGKLTFTDQAAAYGLPLLADEGIKFTDWNNDGKLDLVIHNPYTGPAIYQFDGAKFSKNNIIPAYSYYESYGLNVFDMNNDGREDIITSGGNLNNTTTPTVVLLNNGTAFERSNPTIMDVWGQDTISFADIDGDGKLDIIKRHYESGRLGLGHYKNSSVVPGNSFFKIELVGSGGEHNQQGRVVRIYPQKHPGVIFTRIVDSGSGYLSQGPYDILVGTPYQELHRVEAFFRDGAVSFTINPGERKRVYPDGTTQSY